MMPNCLAYPVIAQAVLKAGLVVVNTNPLYTPREMAFQFRDSGAKALVILDLFAGSLHEVLPETQIKHVVVCRISEYLSAPVEGLVRLVQRFWDRSIPQIKVQHESFRRVLAAARGAYERSSLDRLAGHLGADSIAALQYTGGTTGISKAAVLTHGNILSNAAQCRDFLIQQVREGEEVALGALPLYHIFAFTLHLFFFYGIGGRSVLIPNPRPLTNLKRAFENEPISWVSGVNTLFNGLCNELWFQDSPPKRLKVSIAGGMALQKVVAERWEAMTGTPIIEGYGLTETSPVLTFNPVGGLVKRESIGIPVPSTEIRLIDSEGRDVELGQPGELMARGPQVMKEYWNRPDETRSVMRSGWFATGDIAVMDSDGYFKIVDRKKDMILVSGFNVYPNEVEDVLAAHPDVLEVAVVGMPDSASGESVKAFVVSRRPELVAEELKSFARERLTPYKVPKSFEFRDSLPKSNVGKILRKELRQGARNGQSV
jgi:long-chain acyl-CoA synthetase